MQHDGAGFEQGQAIGFIGGDLPEGLARLVLWRLQIGERQQPQLVILPHFGKRPTHRHVPRQPAPAIGGGGEDADDGCHPRSAFSVRFGGITVSMRPPG